MRNLPLFWAVVSCITFSRLPQHFKEKEYFEYEQIPSFQPIKRVEDQILLRDFSIFLKNDVATENSLKRTYSYSSIALRNSQFRLNSALGMSMNTGTGGCIYLDYGQIHITTCKFEQNYANMAGVLSMNEANLICCDSSFLQNYAFFAAGAISFQAKSTNSFANIVRSQFSECSARECYGSCYFEGVDDLYLHLVDFENCTASVAGGALGVRNCIANFANCAFISNCIGKKTHKIPFQDLHQKMYRRTETVKGGGAIFVANPSEADPNEYELATINCTFRGNKCFATREDGFDIIFVGMCTWISMDDVSDNLIEVGFTLSNKEPGCLIKNICGSFFTGTIPDYGEVVTLTEHVLVPVNITATDEIVDVTDAPETRVSRPPVSEFSPEVRFTQVSRQLDYASGMPSDIYDRFNFTVIESETLTIAESYALVVTVEPTIVVVSRHTETVLVGSGTLTYTIVHFTTWEPSYQQVETLTLTMVDTVISIVTRIKTNFYVWSVVSDEKDLSGDTIIGIIAGAGAVVIIIILVTAWLYYKQNNMRRLRRKMMKIVDEESELQPETAYPVPPPVSMTENPIFDQDAVNVNEGRYNDSFVDPFLEDFLEKEDLII